MQRYDILLILQAVSIKFLGPTFDGYMQPETKQKF
jgi:hypothetical protein